MKKMLFTLCFFLTTSLFAQDAGKYDLILKINGDELLGSVKEILDMEFKFVYKGESLVYSIKKSDVIKITFASGRIEFFNRPSLPSDKNSAAPDNKSAPASSNGVAVKPVQSLQEHHNKVAILPFNYLIDRQDAGESMTYTVQNEAFSFLSKHAGLLELQSTNTTNALLIKAGVTNGNIRGFTMGEICDILGVEFIVQGTINQDRTSVSNYSSGNNSIRLNQNNNNKNAIGAINGRSTYSNVSSSSQNYQTKVAMNVFNDKGESIFSQDHVSFWNTGDAYKITLQYLLKRTPLYRK